MRRPRLFPAFVALVLASGGVALAGETCRVVAVTDGDTLGVRCAQRTLKVRIAEIDAPERRQPFGTRARQHLSDVCFGREALVEVRETDRYGRAVAQVSCDRVDAAQAMVRDGFAWRYERYSRSALLGRLQEEARTARRGLWAADSSVAPWEWRREREGTSRR